MKFKILFGAFSLCLCTLAFARSPSFLVRYVHDGDTVVLTTGEQVRYLGIDAPEIGRNGAKSDFKALESKNYNLRLVRNARVRLEFDEERRDRHGRLLAYVFLESGEMVNLLLVGRGLAFVSVNKPNMRYFDLLLDGQRQAMTEKVGIWSTLPEKPESHYVGNRNTLRFHRPACALGKKITPSNLIRLDTWETAYWEGFSPCRRCRP
jgi:micrococcal nuclease